ncbi:MAG: hypothetical protein Unbinned202contig1002_4 [Prokaryotic dsDNA virus sp.]|nr:MAG: hypothetical protein Unbinned202contig1002_4 [Prokaryotic dsDNA virus sp.]|tara:strand:+ start:831 stop:1121 length:291 start_codon:yes stop_codon:yes gene_type:complete
MIVRRCAQDHDVVIHKNSKRGMTKTVRLANGTVATITYPTSKAYFLWTDNQIIKKSDNFQVIEEEYVKECAKKHSNGNGRMDIVKHKLVNNKVVKR